MPASSSALDTGEEEHTAPLLYVVICTIAVRTHSDLSHCHHQHMEDPYHCRHPIAVSCAMKCSCDEQQSADGSWSSCISSLVLWLQIRVRKSSGGNLMVRLDRAEISRNRLLPWSTFRFDAHPLIPNFLIACLLSSCSFSHFFALSIRPSLNVTFWLIHSRSSDHRYSSMMKISWMTTTP